MTPSRRSFGQTAPLVALAVILAGFALVGNTHEHATYGRALITWLVRQWASPGSQSQHAWLAIGVVVYLTWRKRGELCELPQRIYLPALMTVALAYALAWAGMRTQQPRLGAAGMILAMWSVSLYYWGPAGGRLMLFSAGYLLFTIPMGFLQSATLPLRILASSGAALLLNGVGIGVIRHGTALVSTAEGHAAVDVAAACSGLQSIMALLAVSVLYAYLSLSRLHTRVLLGLSAFPVAIAGNIARIVTITIVTLVWGEERAIRFSHDVSGYVVFVVAVLLMIWLSGLLRRWERRLGQRGTG